MENKFKKLIQFTDSYENKEEIILRDHLAMERTKLANERTLLSYIRTSLYLVLGGIAFLGMKDLAEMKSLGYGALISSAIILIIGVMRYYQLKNHLANLYKPMPQNGVLQDNTSTTDPISTKIIKP